MLEGPGVADRLRRSAGPSLGVRLGGCGRPPGPALEGWSIPRRARAAGGRPSGRGSPLSLRPGSVPRSRRAVERLAEGLLDNYAIDIYSETSQVSPVGLRTDRVGCFHHAVFDRNATYKQYRAVLCYLGNAPEYGFVLDFLETHRAIAVLQDFGLARLEFARAVAAASRRSSTWCGHATAIGQALRRALARLAGDPEALLPVLDAMGVALNRMVFEWAEAVVVTSASGLRRSWELTPKLVEQARVIPWGVDRSGFDSKAPKATRRRLGLSPEARVVGVLGCGQNGQTGRGGPRGLRRPPGATT